MDREQLVAMGVMEGQIEGIMALYDTVAEQHESELAGLRGQLSGWEEKAAESTKRETAEQAMQGLHFSSKGARRAFEQAFCEQGLAEGAQGLDQAAYQAFLEQYQQDDPTAFLQEGAPHFVAPTPGVATPERDGRTQANDALRAMLRRE